MRPYLPAISGDRLLFALVERGWLPVEWTEDVVTMICTCSNGCGAGPVTLPRHRELEHEAVLELIKRARMTLPQLVSSLERQAISEIIRLIR
jgi:hypothetical protein